MGLYGVWANRSYADNDLPYTETIFVMTNDIEITMYTLGASFPVLSRYFVSRAAPGASDMNPSAFSSWYRRARSPFNAVLSHTRSKPTVVHSRGKSDAEAQMQHNPFPGEDRAYDDEKDDHRKSFTDEGSRSVTIDSLGSVLDGEGRYVADYEKYGHSKGKSSGESAQAERCDRVVQREREEADNSWGRTMWLESINASRSRESQEPIVAEGPYDHGFITSAIAK